MIKSKNRLKKTIVGMITFVLAFFLLPFQGLFAAPQEIKDDTDLSALSLYQFQLTTDNMSVVSKSSAVQQYHMDAPGFGDLQHKYPGYPMENFTLKVDKTKKEDQTFDKPLSLKFTNAGTVNGKQVDAYLTINKVTLHYINNSEAPAQMADVNKKTVNFFNVSNLWGANQFEIGNIAYVDEAHDDVMKNTFTVDADITAELKYSDGSEPDMKLVMKPTDIDANGLWNTKEAFYVTNYNTSVDKRVMNNRNNLEAVQEGDKTVWNAGPGGGTSGAEAENNISGLALRSVNNTMNFGYRSANYASATFSLYMEQVQFAPEKEVDPAQIPAQAGEAVTYKTLFKIPKPGKEIIAALSSLDFVDTFDDRLDFKDLTVDADGVVLAKDTDYTVEKSGQKVTVKMAAAYLNKDKAGTPIRITYNTVTNNKVGDKASGPIENIVAMQPDNLYFASNKVTTTLLYNKIHEFESGTPGKTLPQEVTNLLPAKVSGLANGTTVNPTQPTTTKVSVPEGNWVFKGYDKVSEVVENGDVKFIGKWVLEEFTKPVKDVVDGTGTSIDGQETNANDTLTYTVTYTNTTDSARDVTISDNVPEHTTYVENSADNGGTLTDKTLTWTKNVASGETFKVTFQVKVDADVKGQRIDNTAHVDDGLVAADTNTTKNPTPTPKTGNVDVKYVDEDGNVLEGPTQVKTNAPVGEDYTTEQKTFDGYEFKALSSDSAPANGKVTEGDSHVVYVYKKKTPAPQPKTGNVDVKYVDEDGNVLEGPTQVKTNAPVGEDYTTEQKTFDGYEFKALSSDSAPANGKVTEGDSHVVYVYKKKTPAPQPKTGNVDVKYVDEDGNVLEGPTQVKTNAPVGEDYTTEQKTFDGYEFKALSSDSAPANGKVTEGDSHVVYVYKKKTPAPQPKTGNVDVKYVDEDGNVLEGPTQVKTNAPVGEDYTTEQKTFDGYEFKALSSDSAPANGKVTEGDSHVVYVYKKKTPAPQPKTGNVDVKYIDEDGNVLEGPTQVKTNAPVGEDYTTSQKTFDGYEFKALSSDSAPANGKVTEGDSHVVYVYKKKTPAPQPKTGNVDVKYIDEDGNVLEGPTQVKTNAPVGEDYTTEQKTFDGYEFKALSSDSAPANGKVTEGDSHVVYVYKKKTPAPQPKTGNVDVKYIDEDGNVLEGPTQVKTNAPVGEDYTTSQKTFDGYEFKALSSDSAPANGKVTEGDSHVVYVYKKKTPAPQPKTGNVDVKYVDEDGNVLEGPTQVKTNAPVGEDYTTEQKTFDGYEFKALSSDSAPANGKVTEGDSHVVYVYKKKTPAPTVHPITSFVDTKGNTLIPSEDGEQPKKDIPGYRFVETKKLPNGDTEHVYEKVKTSHKDKEGNDIPGYPSEDGEQPKKDIPGYRFVETKKLPNGDIEHVYEKVKTSHKDKEGNDIPGYPSEDGEQPKKDIPGYRFVETKKLPNGDTEHVYEKVKTSHKDKEGNDIPGYPSEDGEQPKKDIPGYRFVETKKLPNGDTEHVYEKVKTSHKDKEGNDIPGYPSEDGEQPKKDIPGYRFVETKKLPNGDTEHVYEKVVTAPQQKPTKATKELPNTGTEVHSSLAALGLLGVLSGFGLVARKKKED